jgi:hypothetical protein
MIFWRIIFSSSREAISWLGVEKCSLQSVADDLANGIKKILFLRRETVRFLPLNVQRSKNLRRGFQGDDREGFDALFNRQGKRLGMGTIILNVKRFTVQSHFSRESAFHQRPSPEPLGERLGTPPLGGQDQIFLTLFHQVASRPAHKRHLPDSVQAVVEDFVEIDGLIHRPADRAQNGQFLIQPLDLFFQMFDRLGHRMFSGFTRPG